jgi:hypothetical protein
MGLIRNLFSVGTICTKGLWETGKFVVKHTPEAVVTIAAIRREVIGGIQEIHAEVKKEILNKQMQDEIKLLLEKKS